MRPFPIRYAVAPAIGGIAALLWLTPATLSVRRGLPAEGGGISLRQLSDAGDEEERYRSAVRALSRNPAFSAQLDSGLTFRADLLEKFHQEVALRGGLRYLSPNSIHSVMRSVRSGPKELLLPVISRNSPTSGLIAWMKQNPAALLEQEQARLEEVLATRKEWIEPYFDILAEVINTQTRVVHLSAGLALSFLQQQYEEESHYIHVRPRLDHPDGAAFCLTVPQTSLTFESKSLLLDRALEEPMDPALLGVIAATDARLAIAVAVRRLQKEPGLLMEVTKRLPDQFSGDVLVALCEEDLPACLQILADFPAASPTSETERPQEKVCAVIAQRAASLEFSARGDLAPLLESARNIPNPEIRKGYLAEAFSRAAEKDVVLASLYLADIVAPEEKAAAIEAILPFLEEPEEAAAWRAELRALQAD